jgi:eukaryotic-like serine/threonine-protein kinase
MDSPQLDTTATAIGDYQLHGRLGEGTHGRFYLATPPARLGLDAERVVVKIVESVDDSVFRRFTRELKSFSRVASTHLVKLYDAGQHEGRFFYSMEHCTRGSLAAARDTLTRDDRLRAVADTARAAHDLHEAGVVHRDIRPGNVLLRADGSACLSDLGLAQFGGGSMTSLAPLTSIGFVDPALITGERAGRPTDIYSLGSLLHWALTGTSVHPAVAGAEPMMAVREVLRTPPHVDRNHLSADEAALVAACVAADPQQRPGTAAEVAIVIDSLIIGSEGAEHA